MQHEDTDDISETLYSSSPKPLSRMGSAKATVETSLSGALTLTTAPSCLSEKRTTSSGICTVASALLPATQGTPHSPFPQES